MAEDAPKQEKEPQTYNEEAKKVSTNGNKYAIILAYLFYAWVGGLIIYLMEKENKFIKWNALQGLILGVIQVASYIVFYAILGWIPYVGFFFIGIGSLISLAALVLAIIATVNGVMGKTFRIPGIAKLADKWFKM